MDEDNLTNQQISKKFVNQFDLVNYAIRLAENMIKTGRGPRVKVDVDNPVVQILAEIEEGKDKFDDVIPETIVEEAFVAEVKVFSGNNKDKNRMPFNKSSDKKKARIMHA